MADRLAPPNPNKALSPTRPETLHRSSSKNALIGLNDGNQRLLAIDRSDPECNHLEIGGPVIDTNGQEYNHVSVVANTADKRINLYVPSITNTPIEVVRKNNDYDVVIRTVIEQDGAMSWGQLTIPLNRADSWTNSQLITDLLGNGFPRDKNAAYEVMGLWKCLSENGRVIVVENKTPSLGLPPLAEFKQQESDDADRVQSDPRVASDLRNLNRTPTGKINTAKLRDKKSSGFSLTNWLSDRAKVKSADKNHEVSRKKEILSRIDTVGATNIGQRHLEERGVDEDTKYSILDYVRDNPHLTEKIQQDVSQKGLVYLVADGVGGHNGGGDASRMATKIFFDCYYRDGMSITDSIIRANQDIYHTQISSPDLYGMSTTFAAVRVNLSDNNNSFTVDTFNVGDSPIYGISPDTTTSLFYEDTMVNYLLQRGSLTPAEAATHPQRNVIMASVGSKLTVDVHEYRNVYTVDANNYVAVYSDGVGDTMTPYEVNERYYRSGKNARQVESDISRECCRISQKRQKGDDSTITIIDLKTIKDTLYSLGLYH